eukprot:XP_019919132.1 PREDICTED: transient receptor potential cation channel subfamily M member 6 [Crassostrea gigas]
MAGIVMDTKIHPSEKYDKVKFRSDQGGAGPSTLTERKYQQDRYYEIQTDLTLEEARYSEMRKKIPGLGRIPKDRIDRQSKESDFHKRNQAHLCFVKQNFHEIECSKFVPDPEKIGVKKIRDLKCHCGEIFTEHVGISNAQNFAERELVETFLVPEELRSHINYGNLFNAPPENLASILSQVTWTKEDAFRKTSCSTFGKICFVNYENSKPAKYIRLSHNDSVDRCLELMDKHWKIMEPKRPSLCISVIGGAKSFKLDNKMRETFNTGLIKAGKSTNAWMITTGSNVGVMKAVGNAVSEGQSFLWDNDRITHTLRLIGIGPWGYVKDRKNLESDGNGCFPVHFQTSNIIQHGKPVPLNPNHTHFVFVDDGFRNNYKGASEFRALFEQKVSKPTQAGGLGIPVVLVIVEGGTDAINDAMVSLNHNIPVVVCSGTGRAADILAYAYSHTRSSKGVLKSKHEIKLRDKINEAYGGRWKENEIDKNIEIHFTNVMKCMEHRNLINIFPMNKHEDLDIAILTALLNSKAAEDSFEIRKNQLQLALTWNRADIAQEEIFREDVLWPPRSLDDILMEAIVEEKVEFVALILQQNVGMKEFLSKERLQQLYQKSLLRADADHLKKLMSSKTRRSTFSYDNLKRLMESLMYKYDHDIEERKTNDNITGRKYSLDLKPEKPQLLFKHPYKQLMVWSILMLRQKMAKFAWQMGSEPITSAVAAARIYGSMAKNVHRNESALKEKVLIFKDEFEHLARSVIDECHAKQKEKAMMLAERKSPSWSEMTSLQIAASGKNMVYLSSVACRNSIDATWRRGILSRWQVLVTVFFPFLLFTPFLNVDAMGEKKVRTFQKILTFYTAPITKFTHYSILYIFFVALFTYFLLVDYQPNEITTIERICIFWIFTFIVDEIYTLLTFPSPTFGGKIRDWYGMLKCIDLFNLLFALLAFVIQVITMHTNENAINVRIVFSINCIIFYIRIMKLYTANSSLGPKLEMIKMMFAELTTFLLVVIVFLAAYGVSRHSLLYGRTEASWKIFTDILFHPYWQLYGELDFDNSMKSNVTCRCHCGEILTEHVVISNAHNNTDCLVPEELRSDINFANISKSPPENLASMLSKVTWTKEDAFRRTPCTTFGKICFVNNENSKPAKYIRLSHNDSVDKCLKLMENHWKIMEPKRPSLCISVIGGAKSFKLDNRMRETFNAGLIKAAKTTNAWLITTGSNVGVMRAVGNAVSEGQSFLWDGDRITHTLRLIGIGPWGYVKNRKKLISRGDGCFPVHFQTSKVIQHGKPVPLNPNHTHFVFVDDGFRNNYKGASEFRALFEQKVSKPTQAGGLGIPVVLVIVEGGTDAINDAMVSLNHNIPVVVCSGTGRAADILAYAYSHIRSR